MSNGQGIQHWISVARRRTKSILKQRKVCSIHQLESKICESGPGDQRPQPHILGQAIKELFDDKQIEKLPNAITRGFTLYALSNFNVQKEIPFIESLILWHRKQAFLKSLPEYCSDVLELMTAAAIDSTKKYRWDVKPVTRNAPLDIEIKFKKINIGIDCKNRREWLYPHHGELWDVLKKCLERDAVPIIITRKVPYVTHLVLSKIGGLAYQTHRQYYSPIIASELTDIQHKDKLGYKDVLAMDQPTKQMINWFEKTLPAQIRKYYLLFNKSRLILEKYAIKQNLGDKGITGHQRMSIYQEFIRELLGDDKKPDRAESYSEHDF